MKKLTFYCFLSILSYGATITIVGPALTEIQDSFLLTRSELGMFMSFLSFGLIISVLLGGYFADRFNTRWVGISGQISLSLGLYLFSLTSKFSVGLFAFFLMGVGGGLIEVVTNTLIAELYRDKRAALLNMLHAFFGIGALLGPFFCGHLLNSGYGWETVYQIAGFFSGIVVLLFLSTAFPSKIEPEKIDPRYFFKITTTPFMILLGILTILYVGSEMGINYWSVFYMENSLGAPKVTASSYLTFFWVAMTGGRFICYLLAKRVSEKKLLSGLSLCSLAFYALFLLSTKPEISGAFLVCVGLFFSGIFPLIISLGIGFFPSSPNTTNGFLLACMGSGVLIFPFAVGAISNKFSLTTGMVSILLFILVFLALSLLLFMKRFSGKS